MDDPLGCGSRCQVVVGTWGGCPVEWLKYSSRQELPPIKIILNDRSVRPTLPSDENEKVLGKFFSRKKGGSQIFRGRAFFRCGGTENH